MTKTTTTLRNTQEMPAFDAALLAAQLVADHLADIAARAADALDVDLVNALSTAEVVS